MNYKFGDKIKIFLKSEKEVGGIFVSSKDENFITVKLDSGYNKVINKKNIEDIKLIKEFKETIPEKKEIKQDSNLDKIKLLHIGGTIASKVDYKTGGVSSRVEPKELIEAVPELNNIARIETEVLFNLLSGNIRFEHQNIIAKKIIESLDDEIAGIIISHGTDTLHYTSAALSFILQNIKIPIILVGAQRSSDRPSSDAATNLIAAAKFIIDQKKNDKKITGVFAAMHDSSSDEFCEIYSGLNLKKMHTSKRDAFKQINTLPVAKYNISSDKIEYYDRQKTKEIEPIFEPSFINSNLKIGIIKAHTNMCAEEILNFKKFDGLVVEATGLGHLPIENTDKFCSENKKVLQALETVSKNIPIIISSQCIYGSTNLNIYSYGRLLKKIGLIEANAMISETAFVKLAWLLSNFTRDEIKEMWNRNFVGEIIDKDLFIKDE